MENNNNCEMKDIYIPRTGKNDTERYVAVNGVNMLIQTGKHISVPAKFAFVLNESERADEAAERFIRSNASN